MTRSASISRSRRAAVAAPAELLRLAAIDVGSNSIHMVISQTETDGSIMPLARLKEMVGLGRGSFPSRRLSQRVMDQAVETLGRFKEAARRKQCERIVAVATSAVREAENGGDFIERVRRELGIHIRVVSAREEARLIYVGVRQSVDLGTTPNLLVDIGGGSVEFIVADQSRHLMLESRKLGAARMTSMFIHSDPVDAGDLKRLLKHYDAELTPICEEIQKLKPTRAFGCSGTLENLAAMCGGEKETQNGVKLGVIESKRLERVVGELLESKSKNRAEMRGLDSQRQEQIIAGALLTAEIFRRLNLKELYVAPTALREGILADYLSRHLPELRICREVPDPRRRSIIDLARRCDWRETHSLHVANLTLQLFDSLRPLHGLGKKERELIEYGAMLHDIGWHIAGKKHHKHSMYLILHGNLKGFTAQETRIIANIARYHRKRPPTVNHELYAQLPESARRIVNVGAALLRLADGLDRSHCRVVTNLRCRIRKRRVEVFIEGRGDAELDIWGARRKMDLFTEVFDRTLSFEQVRR